MGLPVELFGGSVDLGGHVSSLHETQKKKIKSFEGLQTQPSPLPFEKAEPTHKASTTNQINK